MKTVREPAVAGMFYPAFAPKLRSEIQAHLTSVNLKKTFENIFGLVSPHAGYVYSGKTAAYAYKAIQNKSYKTVVVISPSHREYFPGISIYSGDAYKTPLGEIELDKEMIAKLTEDKIFIFEGINGHGAEHALEVQLPFLQTVLDGFKLVPIVMGDQRKEFVFHLAEKLSPLVNNETLIVASSDLSHFHTRKEADKLDAVIENRISSFDYNGLLDDLEKNKCESCGGGPIAVLLRTAELNGIQNVKILSRTDSGDVSGDTNEVVGYLSAVLFSSS
ncbi:MAG: dioxygenase [Ignavibacteria bacterium]|nr:MAG: dioxygenase [Ignavibacteria bacterium]KAF0156401.1 MAG: dioxygenase [Ignavibacteria bacterium]